MNLVVFDIDGTLLDNLDSEESCYAAGVVETLGLTTLNTEWRTYEHVTDEGVAAEAYRRAFGIAPPAERIAATITRFVTLLGEAHARVPLKPIAGVAAMLRELPAHGWTPALATGAWERAARFKLGAAGLRVDDLPFASAEDGPARVAIVLAAQARAERERSPCERLVIVGDGVWDVAAARTLGRPFVGRATGQRATELRAHGAGEVLANFTNLERVLAAFEKASVPRGAAP